jgi:integrase
MCCRSSAPWPSLPSPRSASRTSRPNFSPLPPAYSARRRTLSPATFKRIEHVFGRVLKYAVRKKAIPASPLDATEITDTRATGDDEGFTPRPLTAEQVGAIAAAIEKRYPVYRLAILFLAYTGLRAAELAGLEVQDLSLSPSTAAPDGTPSLARGSVRVTRTKRRRGGEWIVGTPKSRKSRRTVPLDGWLVDLSSVYLATKHPRADEPDAPLFPNRRKGGDTRAVACDGELRTLPRALDWASPVEPGSLYAGVFKHALAAVGLPVSTPATGDAPPARGVRLHDLRHTFAVLSLSAGEHYMMVSKWLGHANFTITLNVYGDYIPEDEGGKAAPLAAPAAPTPEATNVVPFQRRSGS